MTNRPCESGADRPLRACAILIALAALGVAGCSPQPGASPTTKPGAVRRIISISPNSTEIIASLGAADRLVGVSDFCVWPAEVAKLPRIGGLFDVNLEAVLRLQPDLVVLRGRHRGVEDLCAQNGIALFQDKTESLKDIYRTLSELGEILGCQERARIAEREMRQRLDAIATAVRDRQRPAVLVAISRDHTSITSVMTAARGTFVDDMITAAGGRNVFGDLAAAYPTISPEAILVAQPEVVIDIMPEAKMTDELREKLLGQWRAVGSIPAVEAGRVHLLCDENATIPSPRIVEVIERLARWLHPEARFD